MKNLMLFGTLGIAVVLAGGALSQLSADSRTRENGLPLTFKTQAPSGHPVIRLLGADDDFGKGIPMYVRLGV